MLQIFTFLMSFSVFYYRKGCPVGAGHDGSDLSVFVPEVAPLPVL